MSVVDELKGYLAAEILPDDVAAGGLSEEQDLLSDALVDSLGIIKLVTFMEERWGFSVSEGDISAENFRTLNALAAYVEKMQKVGK